MKHVRNRISRWAVIAAVVLAVAAQPLVAAVPAHAAAVQSPSYFDRKAVMKRAQSWVDAGVPYSQTGWLNSYRRDCSGFISMAWRLDQSYVTWSLPEIARPISKEELLPGDIILNTERHVVIFAGWANSAHSAYVVLEQAGAPGKAMKRVVRYPYDSPTADQYKPYRYVGGHSLDEPGNALPAPFMQTYAGNREVLVPSPSAGALNTRIWRTAQKRTIQALEAKRAQARKARKEAAAKAAVAKAAKAKAQREAAAKAAAAKAAANLRAAEAATPPVLKLLQSIFAFMTR